MHRRLLPQEVEAALVAHGQAFLRLFLPFVQTALANTRDHSVRTRGLQFGQPNARLVFRRGTDEKLYLCFRVKMGDPQTDWWLQFRIDTDGSISLVLMDSVVDLVVAGRMVRTVTEIMPDTADTFERACKPLAA